MVVVRLKKLLRSVALMIGAGLVLTFLYRQVLELAPQSKRRVVQSISLGGTQQLMRSDTQRNRSDIQDVEDVEIQRGECKWVEPRFPPHPQWKHTQLIFYGKPIMQAFKSICIERHWRMTLLLNDTSSGLQRLDSLTSLSGTFTILVTASRLYKHPLIRRLANSTNVLVSAIHNAYKIAGGKKSQLVSFRRHFFKYGCDLEQHMIMPKSFILDDPHECLQFFKYANTKDKSWWVLKQSQGYGGTGVSIHHNLTKLYKDFGLCSNKNEYIVQEYLFNVVLINGRKFDIRGIVLIANSDPYLLFYHDGYLRISMKEYSMKDDRDVHITNSHQQMMVKGFDPDKHIWSFSKFQSYLDEHIPQNDGFVSNKLTPFIKKTAMFIFQEGRNMFTPYPSSFQVLGLDFVVTSDFGIWFLEANNYPLWPRGSAFVNELTQTMGNDMFDLLIAMRQTPLDKFMTTLHGGWFKSWQLIWNELDEKCSEDIEQQRYNPCELFPLI